MTKSEYWCVVIGNVQKTMKTSYVMRSRDTVVPCSMAARPRDSGVRVGNILLSFNSQET